ncbi:Dps family protein [Brevibacillus sp. SAFN-007a]|uniref:Dps family protein n=1 Tax=Brevibacillus sp. SAFN-007a TaxID=3436862 RepID=UPI003F7D93DE
MENTIQHVLNKQVANWTVLFTKLHNFHWNVKGPHFFALHAKFEELYNEAAAHIDALAERVLAIGGKPVGTLSASLATASITEAEGNESAEQMVETIARDFSILVDELKLAIEAAEQANDEATAEMLQDIRNGLEKHIWMLNAFLH